METLIGLIALTGMLIIGIILMLGIFADELCKIIREIRRRY